MKKQNLVATVLISLVVLALYLFWFVLSDRRLTFLYGHLHSTPYDANTISRYLMTGLVAGGIIFILYAVFNLIFKKFNKQYQAPNWFKVWQLSSLVLVPVLLVILIFFGSPSLSFLWAGGVVLNLAASMSLALYIGDYVSRNFKQVIFTFLDGMSFVPVLILIPLGIAFGIRKDLPQALIIIPLITIIGGLVWLLIMTFWQKKIKLSFSTPKNIFLVSLIIAYLLGSLGHYLISRSEHLYITNAENFFSTNLGWQTLTLLIVLGMLGLVSWWRKNNAWRSLLKPVLIFWAFLLVNYSLVYLTANKNQNLWGCENDQWVKVGEPEYDQPFAEECGVIDKIIMGI